MNLAHPCEDAACVLSSGSCRKHVHALEEPFNRLKVRQASRNAGEGV